MGSSPGRFRSGEAGKGRLQKPGMSGGIIEFLCRNLQKLSCRVHLGKENLILKRVLTGRPTSEVFHDICGSYLICLRHVSKHSNKNQARSAGGCSELHPNLIQPPVGKHKFPSDSADSQLPPCRDRLARVASLTIELGASH